jgi:trans-2,3-dihydro-3-hydroxyanthranilate isomerase
MQLDYMTVDVFTERRFGGNPLAVVTNAHGLATEQMQSIAAEFNLAETAFVLPPRDPSHTAEVCIFTPRAELPFGGHPNIGTAFVLARLGQIYGRAVGDPLMFEEKAGLVRLELIKEGGAVAGARLSAPQTLKRGEDIALDVVAAACAVAAGDVETANHHPCIASCGVGFVLAELKSRSSLAAAHISLVRRPSPCIFRPTGRRASFSMYETSTMTSISTRECLRLSMAFPKTRRPAAAIARSPGCWRACVRRRI